MDHPLLRRLPPPEQRNADPSVSDGLLDRFLEYVTEKGVELYPAQEEAILEIYSGKNVILNTPTGSGKSLVAAALHFKSASEGRQSVYTCPIKALVNEKFLALCQEFGPDNVGMVTGDASVNRDAPILCCTAEILSNIALREGSAARVHDVIMDEFHYYSDRERGVAWQVPLLTLPQARFLLMSATLGDTSFFEKELTRLTGRETVVVRSSDRPVPLEFTYSETSLDKLVMDLVEGGKAPVYLVNFTQRECAEEAQNLLSVDFCTKEEKRAIASALEGVKFSSPYGKDIQRLLKHGLGIHHAGLLPKYRVLVERLAQRGLLKIICGTDTLGVGVNVPIRTVVFTKLCKFDGEKTAILSVRDFHQISGRAGRKGFDDRGWVIAQAPEHVIENLKMEQKAAGDPKKAKKMVKRKPPEKGYVPWDKSTFTRLIESQPEALVSRFQVSHGMLLNVLSREGNSCRSMRDLIRDCHENDHIKRKLGDTSFQLFRALVDRGIVEIIPPSLRTTGSKLRLNVDLQEDFSLNHALSLYLIDTIPLLDRESPDYAMDLLTLVESILENPDLVLRKQLDRIKGDKLAELKSQGMEYDERMEELEKLEYPKPSRDFIYDTFNDFSSKHPWVGQENIRPKSVAREMFETFQSFSEYIRDYDLHRIEGLLLRYLSEVYKTLVQTVPDSHKSEEVESMIEYFGAMIRQIDSSLLDEWEKMRDPDWVKREEGELPEKPALPADITRNTRSFTVLVRNEAFRVLRALASGHYEDVLDMIDPLRPEHGIAWTAGDLEHAMKDFYLEHSRIKTDPKARDPKNTIIRPSADGKVWEITQVFVDSEEHNDWGMGLLVDLDRSRTESKPVMRLTSLGSF